MCRCAILDGNAYDAKCLEAGQERDEDLEACSLLINNKQQALLVPSAVASHSPTAKVIVQLTVRAALKHSTHASRPACIGLQRAVTRVTALMRGQDLARKKRSVLAVREASDGECSRLQSW